MFIPDPGSASKILTQNIVSKLSEICSGMFISDPDSDFFPFQVPIQRSQRHRIPDPDPQHLGPLFCLLHSRSKLKFVKFGLPKQNQNLKTGFSTINTPLLIGSDIHCV
jgi:hypothetical protein